VGDEGVRIAGLAAQPLARREGDALVPLVCAGADPLRAQLADFVRAVRGEGRPRVGAPPAGEAPRASARADLRAACARPGPARPPSVQPAGARCTLGGTMPSPRELWMGHVVAQRALRTFVVACEREGIDVLPVKGVLTAHWVGADPAKRPLSDVDVRVRPRDLSRVIALAKAHGWPLVRVSRAYRCANVTVDGVDVDVETSVGPPGLCGLRVEDMIARARRTEGALGFAHLEPEIHDHAMVLAVNAFKDKLALVPEYAMRDVELVVEQPGFDAGLLAERARSTGSVTLLWIVADYMYRNAHREPWHAVALALGAPRRRAFARLLRWLGEREPPGRTVPTSGVLRKGSMALRVLSRLAADDVGDRGAAIARMAWWTLEAARLNRRAT
jgi:hypothetical protein